MNKPMEDTKRWAKPPHFRKTERTELTSRSSLVDTWKIDAEIKSRGNSPEPAMPKNKRSLRVLLREFAEETSAHGIGKIASAESVFWRLFWALVTLAGTGMVIYQGILLLETYMSKPVKSDIDVTYSRVIHVKLFWDQSEPVNIDDFAVYVMCPNTVKFPAVTICNLNMIKQSFIHRFPEAKTIAGLFDDFMEGKPEGGGGGGGGPGGPKPSNSSSSNSSSSSSVSLGPPDKRKEAMMTSLNTDSSNADEKLSLSNVSVDSQAYAEDLIVGMLAKHNDSELTKGGHHFHELVYRCSWKDFNCKDGDFLKYWKKTWNWRYGNCYTFNAGASSDGKKTPVLTSTKPGPKYGLTLDLFINQMEYIPSLSQEAGVRVLLTPQRNIPFPVDEGFTLSPGFATYIGLRQLNIVRVDPFNNGSCYSEDEVEKGSIYRKHKGATYSVQGCMYSCLARAQLQNCNCTEGKFRFGGSICSETSEVKCIVEITKKYESDELKCSEMCPQPCSHLSYRTSMSSSEWSSNYEKSIQALMLRQGDANFVSMGKSKDMLRKNLLRIKIYFDELNMEKITYSEYYEIQNLLSDVGGQLGLWIGVSVITCAELLKLLLDIMKVLCRKAYLAESKEVKDISMT